MSVKSAPRPKKAAQSQVEGPFCVECGKPLKMIAGKESDGEHCLFECPRGHVIEFEICLPEFKIVLPDGSEPVTYKVILDEDELRMGTSMEDVGFTPQYIRENFLD